MTNEKIEILCSVLHVSPDRIVPNSDDWYYVEGRAHYVGTDEINGYTFLAQIGPYKVYGPK